MINYGIRSWTTNTSISLKRLILPAAAGFVCLVLFFWLFPTPYARYYAQFERSTMMGLTKDQVLERVGKPTSIIEAEDVWCYQIGRDPGAVFSFTDGKVVEVSVWRK